MRYAAITIVLLFAIGGISFAQQAPSFVPQHLTSAELPSYIAILLEDRLELQKDKDELRLQLGQMRSLLSIEEKRDAALADYWKRYVEGINHAGAR